jgi:hypothetical protein
MEGERASFSERAGRLESITRLIIAVNKITNVRKQARVRASVSERERHQIHTTTRENERKKTVPDDCEPALCER